MDLDVAFQTAVALQLLWSESEKASTKATRSEERSTVSLLLETEVATVDRDIIQTTYDGT